VLKPEPVCVPFRGREVRVRHDDPHLKPYTPMATVLRSATSIASDVEGQRLVLASTVGATYTIDVADDGSEVRLRRDLFATTIGEVYVIDVLDDGSEVRLRRRT
jgi:hypothetical protein